MKTETYKLYSRVFWIFLPIFFIKIDPYNFELYTVSQKCANFEEVGAFLRHSED